jgi:hypothetical protein
VFGNQGGFIPLARRIDASEFIERTPYSSQDSILLFFSLICTWIIALVLGWVALFRLPPFRTPPAAGTSRTYTFLTYVSAPGLLGLLTFGFLFWSIQAVADMLNENGSKAKKSRSFLLYYFANLMVCVMGYRFFYDPVGTENPGWTGVFG